MTGSSLHSVFRRKECGKTFTALTRTPFHRLRGKEQLLATAAWMADGLAIRKTAARLDMTVDKAFRWRHKFLKFLSGQKPEALTGIVEADETRFPVSYKGQRKGVPRVSKKLGKAKNGEGGEETTVVVAPHRSSQIAFDQISPAGTALALTGALRSELGTGVVLSTDGSSPYWTVAKELKVACGSFVSNFHCKVGDGVWHVQTVNRHDADRMTWLRRFKGGATKFLANYLDWRRLLDRLKDNLTPQQFMLHALRSSYQ